MAKLIIRNLSKVYGDKNILNSISFESLENEFIVIVGPSGCGKSTILNLVAGLTDVTSGTIEINDVDNTRIVAQDRNVAMVFQDYALYSHMTVKENIGFYLKLHGVKKRERNNIVSSLAKKLGLYDLLDRKPDTLSGGQKQRVAIARALVRNPDIFLFDEPFANLDYSLREKMRIELIDLHKTVNSVFLYVTHDQAEALSMGDRILVLNEEGIQQFDTPLNLYRFPKNKFVASFIGSPSINFISFELFQTICDDEYPIDICEYTIGIRSEDICIVGKSENGFLLTHSEMIGKDTISYFKKDNDILAVTHSSNLHLINNTQYNLNANFCKFHFFDSNTGERI